MFNEVVSLKKLPKRLSSDNDPLFKYYRWRANLRVLDIAEIKTIPHVPLSHPFVERLIKSIRNELLDQVLFWNSIDLQKKLDQYQIYFNQHRAHKSLDTATPANKYNGEEKHAISFRNYAWEHHCRGLFQVPIAV